MKLSGLVSALALTAALGANAIAQDGKPILIGINSALQLQVGRDTVDGAQMAIGRD